MACSGFVQRQQWWCVNGLAPAAVVGYMGHVLPLLLIKGIRGFSCCLGRLWAVHTQPMLVRDPQHCLGSQLRPVLHASHLCEGPFGSDTGSWELCSHSAGLGTACTGLGSLDNSCLHLWHHVHCCNVCWRFLSYSEGHSPAMGLMLHGCCIKQSMLQVFRCCSAALCWGWLFGVCCSAFSALLQTLHNHVQ
jgi:hypothetical protein